MTTDDVKHRPARQPEAKSPGERAFVSPYLRRPARSLESVTGGRTRRALCPYGCGLKVTECLCRQAENRRRP